jgi:YtoQ family protein
MIDLERPILVYLAGEIHTPWRAELVEACIASRNRFSFAWPVIDHDASDACGTAIFGDQGKPYWNDRLGAGINGVRRRTLLLRSDVVVVRFQAQFGEWNGAFDAGVAHALGKPLITIHPAELSHALKEVDQACYVSAESVAQAAAVLLYAFGDISVTNAASRPAHR